MAGGVQKRTGPQGVSYLVRVEYPPDPMTSKPKQRSKACKTKKDAEKVLAEWLVEIERCASASSSSSPTSTRPPNRSNGLTKAARSAANHPRISARLY